MLSGPYNNYVQISRRRSRRHLNEMIHDSRIVPLDAVRICRPHPPVLGDSRRALGGNTLVVETTNFSTRRM